MNTPKDEFDEAAYNQRVATDVETYGWHVTAVQPEAIEPPWAFTIGLFQRFGHAEILIVGLDFSIMHRVLNTVGEVVRAGGSFAVDSESQAVFERCSAHFKPVHRRWYGPILGSAMRYYGGDEFPALQCFWPDQSGRFPWDAGYDPACKYLQLLFFHAKPGPARAELFEEPDWHDGIHPPRWPFDQAPNVAAITTVNVIERRAPILLVTHYADDDDWGFVCGLTDADVDLRVIGMGEALKLEPSLREVADLPPGWSAWRAAVGGAWQRAPDSED